MVPKSRDAMEGFPAVGTEAFDDAAMAAGPASRTGALIVASIPMPLEVSPSVGNVGNDLAVRNIPSSMEEGVEDAFAAAVGEALASKIGDAILILAAAVGKGMEAELLALLGCDSEALHPAEREETLAVFTTLEGGLLGPAVPDEFALSLPAEREVASAAAVESRARLDSIPLLRAL